MTSSDAGSHASRQRDPAHALPATSAEKWRRGSPVKVVGRDPHQTPGRHGDGARRQVAIERGQRSGVRRIAPGVRSAQL